MADTKPKTRGMAVPAAQVPLWMATFADMMALMMCFFTLLFAMSKTEEEKFKAVAGSLRAALGGVQFIQPDNPVPSPTPSLKPAPAAGQALIRSPIQLPPPIPPAAHAARQAFSERLQTEINNGQIQLRNGPRASQLLIILPEHVSFASGSARLQPAAQMLVDRLIGEAEARAHRIEIGGHTDSLPLRNSRYYSSNWDLSASRAVAVAERILARQLVPPERLSVSGFGATRPIADNGDPAGRARNRRVEILLDFAPPDASSDTGLTANPTSTDSAAAQSSPAASAPASRPVMAADASPATVSAPKVALPGVPVIDVGKVERGVAPATAATDPVTTDSQPVAASVPVSMPATASPPPRSSAPARPRPAGEPISDQQRLIEALRDGGFVAR